MIISQKFILRSKQGLTLPLKEWLTEPDVVSYINFLMTEDQLNEAGFEYKYVKNMA